MKIVFTLNDSTFKTLAIIERVDNFYLELETCSDAKNSAEIKANLLKRQLESFCMAIAADGKFEPHFSIFQEQANVIISGHIANALTI